MGKKCAWGLCDSDSRYPERLEGGVHFIPFPKPPKELEKCQRWIIACGRPPDQLSVEKVTGNYTLYVCSKHFVDGGPTEKNPDPVPATPDTSSRPAREKGRWKNNQHPRVKKRLAGTSEGGGYEATPDICSIAIKKAEAAAVASAGDSLAVNRPRRSSTRKRYSEDFSYEDFEREEAPAQKERKRGRRRTHSPIPTTRSKGQKTHAPILKIKLPIPKIQQSLQKSQSSLQKTQSSLQKTQSSLQKTQSPVHKTEIIRRASPVEVDLQMECEEEELTPCQLSAVQKAWEEHNKAQALIASIMQQQQQQQQQLLQQQQQQQQQQQSAMMASASVVQEPATILPVSAVAASAQGSAVAAPGLGTLGETPPHSPPASLASVPTPISLHPGPSPALFISPDAFTQADKNFASKPRHTRPIILKPNTIRSQLQRRLITGQQEMQVVRFPVQVVPTGPPIPAVSVAPTPLALTPAVAAAAAAVTASQQAGPVDPEKWAKLNQHFYGRKAGDPAYTDQVGEYRVKCWCCDKMLYNNIEAMLHLLGHADSKMFLDLSTLTECRHCFKHFDSPSEMQSHVEELHPENAIIECRICEKKCYNFSELTLHMQTLHKRCEMPYVCLLCNFRCSTYNDILDHFRKHHDGSAHLMCLYCLKLFKLRFSQAGWASTQSFYAHLVKHQSKSHSFRCTLCRLTFINDPLLRQHSKTEHQAHHNIPVHEVVVQCPGQDLQPRRGVRSLNAPAAYKMLEFSRLQLPQEVHWHNCIECGGSMASSDHYKRFLLCSKCRFATNCGYTYSNHMLKRHSEEGAVPSVQFFSDRPLAQPLHCLCGFSSAQGNAMANHLALCSKKTCLLKLPTKLCEEDHPRNRPGASLLDVLGLVKKNSKQRETKTPEASKSRPERVSPVDPASLPSGESKDSSSGPVPESSKAAPEEQSSVSQDSSQGGTSSSPPSSENKPSKDSDSLGKDLNHPPLESPSKQQEEPMDVSTEEAEKDSGSTLPLQSLDKEGSKSPCAVTDSESKDSARESKADEDEKSTKAEDVGDVSKESKADEDEKSTKAEDVGDVSKESKADEDEKSTKAEDVGDVSKEAMDVDMEEAEKDSRSELPHQSSDTDKAKSPSSDVALSESKDSAPVTDVDESEKSAKVGDDVVERSDDDRAEKAQDSASSDKTAQKSQGEESVEGATSESSAKDSSKTASSDDHTPEDSLASTDLPKAETGDGETAVSARDEDEKHGAARVIQDRDPEKDGEESEMTFEKKPQKNPEETDEPLAKGEEEASSTSDLTCNAASVSGVKEEDPANTESSSTEKHPNTAVEQEEEMHLGGENDSLPTCEAEKPDSAVENMEVDNLPVEKTECKDEEEEKLDESSSAVADVRTEDDKNAGASSECPLDPKESGKEEEELGKSDFKLDEKSSETVSEERKEVEMAENSVETATESRDVKTTESCREEGVGSSTSEMTEKVGQEGEKLKKDVDEASGMKAGDDSIEKAPESKSEDPAKESSQVSSVDVKKDLEITSLTASKSEVKSSKSDAGDTAKSDVKESSPSSSTKPQRSDSSSREDEQRENRSSKSSPTGSSSKSTTHGPSTTGSSQHEKHEESQHTTPERDRHHSDSSRHQRPAESGHRQSWQQSSRDHQQRAFHHEGRFDQPPHERAHYRDRSQDRDRSHDPDRSHDRDRSRDRDRGHDRGYDRDRGHDRYGYQGQEDYRRQGHDRSPGYRHGGGQHYGGHSYQGYQGQMRGDYHSGGPHGNQGYRGNYRGYPHDNRRRGGYRGGYHGNYY